MPLRELDALMAEADAFCASEQLLTVPRSPALRGFTAWYLAQPVGQLAGSPPEPYDGPLGP